MSSSKPATSSKAATTATTVVLPPCSNSAGSSGTRVVLPPASSATRSAVAADPNLLLDAFDAFTANHNNAHKNRRPSTVTSNNNSNNNSKSKSNSSNNTASSKPDPIVFLNQHFTTESLLVAQLPLIRDAVADRMNSLDDRISTALQRQSESAPQTLQHMQEAKDSVASLQKRIRQVQLNASQSEQTVREITKDMKRLDCAKRQLQRTITTLKRLHMLIHAVEQLRLACLQEPFPNYKEASHLVDAIRFLLQHFEAYQAKVEPMAKLSHKVHDLQGELKFLLIRAFRVVAFGEEATKAMEKKQPSKQSLKHEDEDAWSTLMPPPVMADGILLIDALGKESRDEFISIFGQDHLAEYSKIYKPVKKEPKEEKRVSSFKVQPQQPKETKPEFALEFIEQRFMWFRKMLTAMEDKYPAVFPNYWNMEYLLTKTFLKRTRGHIMALLNGPTKDPEANNATVLLKALQKTIQFEKEVTAALQREYGTTFLDPANPAPTPPPSTDERASTEQASVEPLLGVASSAFDNYMGPYIALEEQSMDEQLVMALEDRAVDTRGELPVFTTSTKLFIYIKGSVTRCTALTKGNAFYLLYQAFQDSLRKYAQVLSSKLPPPLPAKPTGGLNLPNVPFAKADGNANAAPATYRVPPGEEVTACHVIGTCEYCAETVEALEDLIRDTVDAQYQDKINMMPQQEAFHDIAAKAVRVLVSGLETRLDDAFRTMSSIHWAAYDEVGEESDYVRTMHREIQPYITTIRGLIPTSYFRSICDKFAMAFGTSYYDAVIRLKTINELGCQQLLLDVSILKSLFLKLPVLEADSSHSNNKAGGTTIAPVLYTKMVQKQFKKIELLLKLTGTPVSMLIDVFRDQWPGGSALDLQTVMSLKGMKRTEQVTMLEKFGLDPATARKGATMNITSATIVQERFQVVQGQAARVNNDLNQMRQKVDDFRRAFR